MKADKLTALPIIPEEYDVAHYEKVDYSQLISLMHPVERRFINGLIRYYQPEDILEVGVAYGGGTINILNAISDMHSTSLTSIDRLTQLNDRNNRGIAHPIGHLAKQKYPDLPKIKWNLIGGKDPSEIMESLDKTYDFCVLDTAHMHPVENLNFLCILPYLKDGAIVLIHDTLYFANPTQPGKFLAPRILISSVVADKLMPATPYPLLETGIDASNVFAIQITRDTRKYIDNVFQSLMLPWEMPPIDIRNVRKSIAKHYTVKQIAEFDTSVKLNLTWIASGEQSFSILCAREAWMKWQDKPVIFYGAGGNMKFILSCLNILDIPFEFPIWDQNAEKIMELDGHKVLRPDLDTKVPSDHVAVITIADNSVARSLKEKLEALGYIVFIGTKEFLAE